MAEKPEPLIDITTSDGKSRVVQEVGEPALVHRYGIEWGAASNVTLAFAYDLNAARARIKELEAGLRWYSGLDDPEEAKKWHCVHQGDPRDKILSLWDLGHRARDLLTKEPSDAD